MGLSAIGPVMQFAFVPKDFDAALRHWTETMGVGPFFLLENNLLGEGIYLGEPYHCVFTIAIAYRYSSVSHPVLPLTVGAAAAAAFFSSRVFCSAGFSASATAASACSAVAFSAAAVAAAACAAAS